MNELFDQLELELRRLPGVTGVGLISDNEGLVVYVSAEGQAADRSALRRTIAQQIRGLVDGPIAIEIDHVMAPVKSTARTTDAADLEQEPSAPQGPEPAEAARPPRVRLADVEIEGYTSDVVVRLTHAGRQAVGRGEAGSPADAARATMRALNALGASVPFTVHAMSSPVGESDDQAVVVMLASNDEAGHRYGIARASTIEEAACRATLHALNRWLSAQDVFAQAG